MIYLDNAATTKMEHECSEIIQKYNEDLYFNPSALYNVSNNLMKKIDEAKKNIIHSLGGDESANLIFTSGATEANNLAIFGSSSQKQKTYLFGVGEHPAVYNTAVALSNKGFDVKFIPLNSMGEIDIQAFKKLMTKDVCFVSVMLVNNETGAINDIKSIRHIIDSVNTNTKLHVDAVQAFCKIPFNIKDYGIDLCTISAHKIHGPKGIGALYIAPNVNIKNITYGGGQEKGLRSGTYNVSNIMAFEKAVSISIKDLNKNLDYVKTLKQKFLDNLSPINDKIIINGDGSPYILSISIDGIRGETVLHMLEVENIIIGTGSACSSNKVENRVLQNLGRTKSQILGSIRISFSKFNTLQEVDIASKTLVNVIQKLLQMSKRK